MLPPRPLTRHIGRLLCVGAAIALAGCGEPSAEPASPPPTVDASGDTALGTVENPAPTEVAPAETQIVETLPAERSWLLPDVVPADLRPVEADIRSEEYTTAACVPGADCGDLTAIVRYASADGTGSRTIDFRQVAMQSSVIPWPVSPTETPVVIGERHVTLADEVHGEWRVLIAQWTEALTGALVKLETVDLTRHELDAFIDSLALAEPAAWAALDVAPVAASLPCVDAASQVAPTFVPEGWQQIVLSARPTGSYGTEPVAMLSLVEPGTPDAPGRMVTIIVTPTGLQPPQPGEPITIGDRPATIERDSMGDGTSAIRVSDLAIGSVVVAANATNVDEPILLEILAGMAPVDDAAWASIVASVATPPA